MRTVLKLVLGGTLLCLSAVSCCAAGGATILVLDATAQMSAKFGQQRKIDAVKRAVTAAASRMTPEASLAVWTFGTDPGRKCEGRGELVRLQQAGTAAAALGKALAQLEPKAARAPVFGTLQAALESLGDAKDAGISAILIAGTGDDCTGDICSEAKKLHSAYPNAKLTVLGAGMSEQAAANFTCAAKAMGGSFTAVKSASDLDRLLRQALDTSTDAKPLKAPLQSPASGDAPSGTAAIGPPAKSADPAPPATPPSPPEMQPAAQPPAQPEPNTLLSAVLADGMPPLGAGVTWEIYKISTTPTGQLRTAETPGWTGGGGQARVRLAEGRYTVRAAYGLATAEDGLTVTAGKTEKTLSLKAGTLAAEGLQAQDAGAAEGVFFILYRRKTVAALEELGRSSESPALFHVNAGEYVLSASAALAKLETNVKVEAGKVSVVRVALNVGVLEIKTFAAEGLSKPVPAWHRLYPVAADPSKGAAPLLIIEGGVSSVQIPAGSYRLQTVYGNARVESAVSVAAGQTVLKNVILDSGEAKISLPSGKTAQICDVYEAGASRSAGPAGRAAGTSQSFILKAGDYEVECGPQGASGPSKQTRIRVVAGQTHESKIEE